MNVKKKMVKENVLPFTLVLCEHVYHHSGGIFSASAQLVEGETIFFLSFSAFYCASKHTQ